MKIRIISVGKVKQGFIKAGEKEYQKRLPPHVKLDVVEIEAGKGHESGDIEKIKELQSQAVLSVLKDNELLVVLDEIGQAFNSTQFSDWLQGRMVRGDSQFVFAIGGPYGWSSRMRSRADLVLSLSHLTFPYQLCRFILIEQLYRAFSIMEGSPYHKA